MMLEIDLATQILSIIQHDQIIKQYLISSAKKGAGELYGSEQTPRGWHVIRAKIGKEALVNTVFIARRPTGEIFTPEMQHQFPNRDWILTRIMWLSGLEPYKNRLGKVDTMRRKIYIHGSPDHAPMGVPGSRGCIRMHNQDMIDLFNRVPVGTRLLIK